MYFMFCEGFLPDRKLKLYSKMLQCSFQPINPADMVKIQQPPDDFFINLQALRQFYVIHWQYLLAILFQGGCFQSSFQT